MFKEVRGKNMEIKNARRLAIVGLAALSMVSGGLIAVVDFANTNKTINAFNTVSALNTKSAIDATAWETTVQAMDNYTTPTDTPTPTLHP